MVSQMYELVRSDQRSTLTDTAKMISRPPMVRGAGLGLVGGDVMDGLAELDALEPADETGPIRMLMINAVSSAHTERNVM